MTTKEIVKFIYDYVENADCSCQDEFGRCWYHMTYEERIEMLTREIESRNENH